MFSINILLCSYHFHCKMVTDMEVSMEPCLRLTYLMVSCIHWATCVSTVLFLWFLLLVNCRSSFGSRQKRLILRLYIRVCCISIC